ncbi:unnamed protein product [Allacma fusca]|uniref:Uncharacterized protein n=1 Tax=Allacma fusca TaxID=39272 RepID=A0A8J2LDU8_9HEXA|nr:unnamed protein product [Allacma fusca]
MDMEEEEDLDSLRAAALSSLLKNKSSTRFCNSNTLFHRPTVNKNLISIIPVEENSVDENDKDFSSLSDKAESPDNEEYVVIEEGEDVDEDEVDEIIEEVIEDEDEGGNNETVIVTEEVVEESDNDDEEEIIEHVEEAELDDDALSFASNDSFLDVIQSLEEEIRKVPDSNAKISTGVKSKVIASDSPKLSPGKTSRRESSPSSRRREKSPRPDVRKEVSPGRSNRSVRKDVLSTRSSRRETSPRPLVRRESSPVRIAPRRELSPGRLVPRREASPSRGYNRRESSPGQRNSRRDNLSPIRSSNLRRENNSPPWRRDASPSRKRDASPSGKRDVSPRRMDAVNARRDRPSRRDTSPFSSQFKFRRDASSNLRRENSPKLKRKSPPPKNSNRRDVNPKSSRFEGKRVRRDISSNCDTRNPSSNPSVKKETSPLPGRSRRDHSSSRESSPYNAKSQSQRGLSPTSSKSRREFSPSRDNRQNVPIPSLTDLQLSHSQQSIAKTRNKQRKRSPSPRRKKRARHEPNGDRNRDTSRSPVKDKLLESRRAKFEQNSPIDITTKKIRLNPLKEKESGGNLDNRSADVDITSEVESNKNSDDYEDLRTKLTQKRASAAGRLFSTALKSTLVVVDNKSNLNISEHSSSHTDRSVSSSKSNKNKRKVSLIR